LITFLFWQVVNGQQIPAGYWLVDAKWYSCVQRSHRAYVLLPEVIKLNVNALVRLPDAVEFDAVKARKKPTAPVAAASREHLARNAARAPAAAPAPAPKPQREKPNFLGEPKHNEILGSLAQVRL
jgi:hypothetical protein